METKDQTAANDWTEEVGKRAPNILTLFRIFLVPIFVFLMIDPTPTRSLWATVIFVVASLTDWLDGYLARLYHAETIVGKLLDPLADKVLVLSALVMLTARVAEPHVPAWIVVFLLARDVIVTGLRSLAAVQGVVVSASTYAKYKTAFTMIGIFLLLLDTKLYLGSIQFDCFLGGMAALWIALFLSVSTGFAYAVKLRKMFL